MPSLETTSFPFNNLSNLNEAQLIQPLPGNKDNPRKRSRDTPLHEKDTSESFQSSQSTQNGSSIQDQGVLVRPEVLKKRRGKRGKQLSQPDNKPWNDSEDEKLRDLYARYMVKTRLFGVNLTKHNSCDIAC